MKKTNKKKQQKKQQQHNNKTTNNNKNNNNKNNNNKNKNLIRSYLAMRYTIKTSAQSSKICSPQWNSYGTIV